MCFFVRVAFVEELKKLLSKLVNCSGEDSGNDEARNGYLDELQEFANDECDYGMGLEFGINLFAFGHDDETLCGMVGHVLPLAYRLLKRDLFAEILEAHLENRGE